MTDYKALYKNFMIAMLSFVVGLVTIGVYVLGGVVHESGHAIACFLLKVPFSFAMFHVTPKVSVSGLPQTIIGLSGGLMEALVSVLCLWIVSFREKRGSNWFSFTVGVETLLLTMFFVGAINSAFEGFFHTTYQAYSSNTFVVLAIFAPSVLISIFIIIWKFKMLAGGHTLFQKLT